MRILANIANVTAPSSDYPGGRIRNKDNTVIPPVVGTPIVEELYGDIIQLMQMLLNTSGITANDLPDNTTNGFQLRDALMKSVAILNNYGLYRKYTDYGPWNMDTTPTFTISTVGFNLLSSKIKGINITVKGSDNISRSLFGNAIASSFESGGVYNGVIDGDGILTSLTFARANGGSFDDPVFANASICLIIDYIL